MNAPLILPLPMSNARIEPLDGIASAHKAIDYIRQILRNGRADNAVVASIEDASKLESQVDHCGGEEK